MKLMTPILQPDTELIEADAKLIRDSRITDERIQGRIFRNLVCEEEDFSYTIFSGVRFESCRFWNCAFERAEFTDIPAKESEANLPAV